MVVETRHEGVGPQIRHVEGLSCPACSFRLSNLRRIQIAIKYGRPSFASTTIEVVAYTIVFDCDDCGTHGQLTLPAAEARIDNGIFMMGPA